MIKQYDKIRLNTGERASILELFKNGDYLAEIVSKKGDIKIEEIKKADIKAVIKEIEEPFEFIEAV
jgi:hypothetical protein